MTTAIFNTLSSGKQKYSRDFLQSIVDSYPIAEGIQEYRQFELGSEDTNYFVEVGDYWYVVKIFETPDVPAGSNAYKVDIMDMTFRMGLKTPRVYRNNQGSLMTKKGGKQAIVIDFAEGQLMARAAFSDNLMYETGQEAGKMDSVLASLDGSSRVNSDFSFDLRHFLSREGRVDILPQDFDRNVFHSVFESFRKIKPAFDELPSGIIHHDIVAHNIIAADERLVAIIDFSDVVHAPYAQNIAATLCQTVFWYNWNPAQAGIFLKGYREHHSFSEDEASLLFDLTLARYAILIIGLNDRNIRYGNDARRTTRMHDRYSYFKRLMDFGRDRFNDALAVSR